MMMATMGERSLLEDASATRLLAKKSSYQAWKCVSFGCSLLALLLLLSKWQEVSSDLQLLLNIQHLVGSTAAANNSNNNNNNNGTTGGGNSPADNTAADSEDPFGQWPPPLPSSDVIQFTNNNNNNNNETMTTTTAAAGPVEAGDENAAKNHSNHHQLLVSHLHISVGRELQGNQLLKREVEIFIAEFRGAKSTISLSSLLVSVYIISWILMTLAINDARISNDISLRNILLLSVFGAIDMAASLGFVLVRLIMYSVKNNAFRGDMLASVGLKDTPIRMAPDQLTAFTALRLIAMRSCSAYMDIYVSFIVVLLTVLRLYAILQALAYYKNLRRSLRNAMRLNFNTRQEPPPNTLAASQQQQQQHHHQWQSGGPDTPPSVGPKRVWSMFPLPAPHQESTTYGSYESAAFAAAAQQAAMISGQTSPQLQQQIVNQNPGYSSRQQQQQYQLGDANKRQRPTSRTSWQQPQPAPPLRPKPPQRHRGAEVTARNLVARATGDDRQQQQQQMIESRSPSPVQRAKWFQFQRRQLVQEDEPPAATATTMKQQQEPNKAANPRLANTLRASDGTTYTLLSANQLERISRKLLEASHDSNNNNNNTQHHDVVDRIQQRRRQQQIKNVKSAAGRNQAAPSKRKRQPNNFELLLAGAAAEDERLTGFSAADDDGDNDGDDNDDDDNGDNDNDSDLSQGDDSTGAGNRRHPTMAAAAAAAGQRLLSGEPNVALRRHTDRGYLIEENNNTKKKSSNANQVIRHQHSSELSSSAKNKLLLAEYLYA